MEKSTLFDNPIAMDAPEVAKGAYKALFEGRSMINPSKISSVILKIVGLLPKNLRMKTLMDALK